MHAARVLSLATGVVLFLEASAGGGSLKLGTVTVTITAAGPSPASVHVTAGLAYPSWKNGDGTAHRVVFANGRCGLTLAPSGSGYCSDTFWGYVGTYPYTIGGLAEERGEVVVGPAPRRVTIAASPKTVGAGSSVTLRGQLYFSAHRPRRLGQPVSVLARPGGANGFSRVAVVAARSLKRVGPNRFAWRLVVRPETATVYKARASAQPRGGTVWARAESPAVEVRVRR